MMKKNQTITDVTTETKTNNRAIEISVLCNRNEQHRVKNITCNNDLQLF